MNTVYQLEQRAKMILNDGRDHAKQAIEWANNMLHITRPTSSEELLASGFSLRELSLGAEPCNAADTH